MAWTEKVDKPCEDCGALLVQVCPTRKLCYACAKKRQKANNAKTDSVTIFGTLKIMAPTVGLITALWLLIIITWYIVGLPLGPGMYPTL